MKFRTFAVVFIASTMCGFFVCAQVHGSSENGPAPTLSDLLKQQGISISFSSLVAALGSPKAEVRELAALKLAEDNAKDAIPSIQVALATEANRGSGVNIAFALAQLGDQQGISALTGACSNSTLNTGLRLRAVRYLLDLHRDACLTDLLSILKSTDEDKSDYRAEALSLLPSYGHDSQTESKKIVTTIAAILADPTPAVRISASDALARLGSIDAIPALRNAIAIEREEAVRVQLELALQQLQKNAKTEK